MTNDKTQNEVPISDDSGRNNSTATTIAHNRNITDANADANTNDDDDIPPIFLSTYWHEWSRCLGSRYQMDQLYRNGKMDNCSKQWKDLQLAIQARYVALNDPAKAHRLIQTTTYQKRLKISPTAGSIWELKSEPGWN
eukprot:CAMPEP_0113478782 /NCGR_PEP_ID=MMETSP0014_2-20120614/20944_1 /TAXON_ID=2857 /ORGANISM="Nitzschia sp." /LENGTH=137 /DNA_ID=CAMNT_0000372005 /DNA_START=62 /DNA_END=475 /DNA_ORIENTATION=- /assembly_acc=CAM_ASM_000159